MSSVAHPPRRSSVAGRPLRGLAALLVAALAACGTGPAPDDPASAAPPERPDLIVVVLDSLRADALGREVGGRPVMPRLDAWSRGAVRFTNARAPSCSTPTTVGSLFTSLPVPAIHVTFWQGLPAEVPVLAETLSAAGYATRAYSANPNVTARLGHDRGFDLLHEAYVDEDMSEGVRIQPRHPGWIVRPEALLGRALHDLGNAGDEPQLVYIHLLQPHAPYEPPEPYRGIFGDLDVPDVDASIPSISRHNRPDTDPGWIAGLRLRYDEHVHWGDAAVGDFLDELAADERLSRAAVVILSDHGEEFGEHQGLFHNATVYEEVLRVPLVVKWPEGGPAAQVVKERVGLIDLAPTLLAMAGVEAPPSFRGIDLAAVVRGEAPSARRFLSVARPPPRKWPRFAALLDGDIKLIYNEDTGAEQIFDLSADPGEREDLTASRPDLRGRLVGAMREELRALESLGFRPGEPINPPRSEMQMLRALGYVE